MTHARDSGGHVQRRILEKLLRQLPRLVPRQRPVKDASERESESRAPVIDKRCLMLLDKHEERDYSPRPAPECSCQRLKTSPNSARGISSKADSAPSSATASMIVNMAASSLSIRAT